MRTVTKQNLQLDFTHGGYISHEISSWSEQCFDRFLSNYQQGWPSSTSFGMSEGSHWGSSPVGAERLQSSSHPEPWHSQGIFICHAITIMNCFWAEISLKVVRLFSGTVLSDLNKQVYKDLSYDLYDSTLNGVVAAVSLDIGNALDSEQWWQVTFYKLPWLLKKLILNPLLSLFTR